MLNEVEFPRQTQIGRCDLASVQRVAAMLDLEPGEIAEGGHLPRGWHFFLLGGTTRRSSLREDGFPGFGAPMPDFGMKRLLLGGRTISYFGDIEIGAQLERESRLESYVEKTTKSGPIIIAKFEHQLRPLHSPAPILIETQTYILLNNHAPDHAVEPQVQSFRTAHQKTVTPDPTMLFQYSALGFNSHRIHLDRDYARDAEGFPDLIINGGLTTLLLTEFLRSDLGIVPGEIKAKHTAPLFCDRPVVLTADRIDDCWHLKARDNHGAVALELEVSAK
ncbi:MAG: hypothetical protein HQ483_04670 [Rhodospirillales bacterium]|nr:hypothetical protein [Rhodospirillales bacterium]